MRYRLSQPGLLIPVDRGLWTTRRAPAIIIDPAHYPPLPDVGRMPPIQCAAAYDSTATGNAVSATSIANFTLTLVGSSNMAVMIGIGFSTAVSAISITVGGTSATLISGTSSTNGGAVAYMYGCVKGSSTGAQTVSISWTTSAYAIAHVVACTGVDQTTPFNNGNQNSTGFSSGTESLAITSTNGDLTYDFIWNNAGGTLTSPTQTQRQNVTNGFRAACSTGPGTGTTTHTWTAPSGDTILHNGANFNQASAGGRTTKNTRAFTLGTEAGMNWRGNLG